MLRLRLRQGIHVMRRKRGGQAVFQFFANIPPFPPPPLSLSLPSPSFLSTRRAYKNTSTFQASLPHRIPNLILMALREMPQCSVSVVASFVRSAAADSLF